MTATAMWARIAPGSETAHHVTPQALGWQATCGRLMVGHPVPAPDALRCRDCRGALGEHTGPQRIVRGAR